MVKQTTRFHLDPRRRRWPTRITWTASAIVALAFAALSVSVTAQSDIDIKSSHSGTVAHDASTGDLVVTVTLDEHLAEGESVEVFLVSLKRNVATLILNDELHSAHQLSFRKGGGESISYRVKPLANDRAAIG